MSVLPTVEEAKDMLARAMDPDAYPDDNEDSIYKYYGYMTEDVFVAFVEQRLVSVDDYDYTLQVDEDGRFFVTQKDVEETGPKNLLLVMPGTYRLVRVWDEAVDKCPHDPMTMLGKPIGQYHCPECGEMVVAGMPHL